MFQKAETLPVSNGMNIAINGFGRIGRIFFRQAWNKSDFNIVAINDLADKDNLMYLLRHDSVYNGFDITDEEISNIQFTQEKDPASLPWKELEVDVVVESTGFFTSSEKARGHIEAGAKRVIITAPAKDEVTPTLTPGMEISSVGENLMTSNASCTTNAVIPIVSVMTENPGIKKAILNTIHAYTSSQGIVDKPDAKDFRRGRAGALNMFPTTTGAALATGKVIPEIDGKFDGVSVRVPLIAGSLVDFTFVSEKSVTVEEVNDIFRKAAQEPRWQGVIKASDEPLVSSDILGEPYGSIIDLKSTNVIDGDLVKIFSWYDNEWGYGAMLIKHIEMVKELL